MDTDAFVDKTLFIKAFLEEENDIIVVTAPRRFGKSTNMDMIREFVSGNKNLFKDNQLKIWREKKRFFFKYCKENPVIHMDFKNIGGKTTDEVLGSIRTVIQDAYDNHKYIMEDPMKWGKMILKGLFPQTFTKYWRSPELLERKEIISELKWLSKCLHLYHNKPVYVFIDECDAFIMQAIMKTNPEDGVLDKTIHFISAIISDFLKDNVHVKRGLINVSAQIADVLSKDANNIIHYPFLSQYAPYFGFTAAEVNSLFKRDEFIHLQDDAVKDWFGGYEVIGTNDRIYNSYSILSYLQQSKQEKSKLFDYYWVNSESITNMKELFAKVEIRQLIEDLINDEEVEITITRKMSIDEILTLKSLIHQQLDVPTITHAHLFLQFLSDYGYLNVVKYIISTESITRILRVPNKEIKKLLKETCYNAQFFVEKYQLCLGKIHDYVEALYLLLKQKDRNAFIRFAKAVSELFDGALIPKDDGELHSILFTLVYNFRLYEVWSKLNVQRIKRRGRLPYLDIFVVLGEVGMIIELKDKSSEMAHTQILTQGYAFDEYKNVTVKILLGLHMNEDKKVSLTYTVDNSVKQTVTSND